MRNIPVVRCVYIWSVKVSYQQTRWAPFQQVHSWTEMLQFKLITQATQGFTHSFNGTNCVLLPINLSSVPDLSTSSAPEQLPL